MVEFLVVAIVLVVALVALFDLLRRGLKIGFGYSFVLMPTDKVPEFLNPPK